MSTVKDGTTPRPLPERLTPYLRRLADHSPAVARQFMATAAEASTTPNDLDDPIGDAVHSPLPGLVHRYPDRVLVLPSMACAAHCRFCFRRNRVGVTDSRLSPEETSAICAYIAKRPAIHEVIFSGGDPLTLPPADLAFWIKAMAAIPHIEVIRLHTRLPLVDPRRAVRVASALSGEASVACWAALHVNHPDELTPDAITAIRALQHAGVFLVSQTVLLAGVNDTAETLCRLFRALVRVGIKPYYLHHPDHAAGTEHFRVPLAKGRALVEYLRMTLSGLAQPSYILDVPGGHGKVWACDAFVTPATDGSGWIVRSPDGTRRAYAD